MKSAISSTYLFNIIFIFLVVVFAFVMGTIAYYKSFKVNKNILAIIEKYEGYNQYSRDEIEQSMGEIGYNISRSGATCPSRSGVMQDTTASKYRYCVYYNANDGKNGSTSFYYYGVVTYMSIDLPFVNIFLRIPIYTKSNRIYRFGSVSTNRG